MRWMNWSRPELDAAWPEDIEAIVEQMNKQANDNAVTARKRKR